MNGAIRQWVRQERDRLVRAELIAKGYVLDYWFVYRLEFRERMTVATAHPLRKAQVLRTVSKGSSRKIHAERMERMRRRP